MTKLFSLLLATGLLFSGCELSHTETEATVLPSHATPLDNDTTETNISVPEEIQEPVWGARSIKRVADRTRDAVVEVHNPYRGVR